MKAMEIHHNHKSRLVHNKLDVIKATSETTVAKRILFEIQSPIFGTIGH